MGNVDRPLSFSDFSSFTGMDGVRRDIGELEGYLREQRANPSFAERLEVGDVVVMKFTHDVIEIEYVDYEMRGIGTVDYAGRPPGDKTSPRLRVFNQHEIEGRFEE